jgi:hypothetical protein
MGLGTQAKLFAGLAGRQVIINGHGDVDWMGRVAEVRNGYVRLEDYSISQGGQPTQAAAGVARIPLDAVAWVSEI